MPTDAQGPVLSVFSTSANRNPQWTPARPLPVKVGASPSITSAACTWPWTDAPTASSPLEPGDSMMDWELDNRKETVAFPAPVYFYFSLNLERRGFQQAAPTCRWRLEVSGAALLASAPGVSDLEPDLGWRANSQAWALAPSSGRSPCWGEGVAEGKGRSQATRGGLFCRGLAMWPQHPTHGPRFHIHRTGGVTPGPPGH